MRLLTSFRVLKYCINPTLKRLPCMSYCALLKRLEQYGSACCINNNKSAILYRKFCTAASSRITDEQKSVEEAKSCENADDMVNVIFVTPEGEEVKVKGKVGTSVMELGVETVEMEGACEGQLACTTCHVYVDENYESIQEASSEEEDLLDNAPFLKPNSRLSCQIKLAKDLEGARFMLPPATVNFHVDGSVPKKH